MANILIIEDDDQLRTMLREMLERIGYKVTEARNGNEGIERYRENPADLVITDIIMPEKEGVETIIELTRDFPDVNIIAISGGGRVPAEEYLRMVKKLGAKHTLVKPFIREKLLEAVKDLIG
ncbi:response regulator [bacterium]|nr:response regulator [bacterium]